MNQLADAFEKAGLDEKDLTKMRSQEVMTAIIGILRGAVELVVKTISFIASTFTVMVDETISVEEAVKDGKFDWSHENIDSTNFPKPDSGAKVEKEMALFHFGKGISSEGAIAQMDAEGYRPATIHEALAFAKAHPELQRQFPIVALGSATSVGGDRFVAGLYRRVAERGLDLLGFDDDVWVGSYRFLAVRK